ncbi:hypothetical protein [Streptomyces coeruleorubidus]|uniref:Uncharacterized protein n=1 Tax=Streptomyces coeruleorubidus TaxID=116188 RepID=A0A5J6HXM0_STRC4|nr:hypothetical protein [Streptomyces coeruleorubidus]QEV23872.1 hypothetical protein CP976_06760 [Streptomyces coeruleorubidus]GGT86479.1 hypothetical protein GCM10010256_53410 [Streptomyces coeruleorubidus]
MRVRTLDGTEAAGTQLVLAVLEHAETAPVGPWTAQLGMAAVVDGSGAVWFVGTDDVGRLVSLPCECEHVELTTYKDGAEISRTVGVNG